MPRGCALHNDTEGGAGVADWQKIKTEYITTDTSYRKLGEKYGIHYKAISDRGKAEGWVQLRSQHRDKTLTKTIEKISERQSEELSRICSIADKLLDKLEQAADELDKAIIIRKTKVETAKGEETTERKEAVDGGIVDRVGLRQLTAALKDLKEVKMLRSALDEEEQRARIENLRRTAQKDDSKNGGKITVVLEGALEEYAG